MTAVKGNTSFNTILCDSDRFIMKKIMVNNIIIIKQKNYGKFNDIN